MMIGKTVPSVDPSSRRRDCVIALAALGWIITGCGAWEDAFRVVRRGFIAFAHGAVDQDPVDDDREDGSKRRPEEAAQGLRHRARSARLDQDGHRGGEGRVVVID